MSFVAVFAKKDNCIHEFQPNTRQANYFEGFWRITSKTNTKIEVRKQDLACRSPIRLSLEHMLLKSNEFLPAWPSFSFLSSNPSLFWLNHISKFMFVCL